MKPALGFDGNRKCRPRCCCGVPATNGTFDVSYWDNRKQIICVHSWIMNNIVSSAKGIVGAQDNDDIMDRQYWIFLPVALLRTFLSYISRESGASCGRHRHWLVPHEDGQARDGLHTFGLFFRVRGFQGGWAWWSDKLGQWEASLVRFHGKAYMCYPLLENYAI